MEDYNWESFNIKASTTISILITIFIKVIFSWAIHTIGAVLTACIVAFVVYHFNNFLKERTEKNKLKKELERKKKIDSIKTII